MPKPVDNTGRNDIQHTQQTNTAAVNKPAPIRYSSASQMYAAFDNDVAQMRANYDSARKALNKELGAATGNPAAIAEIQVQLQELNDAEHEAFIRLRDKHGVTDKGLAEHERDKQRTQDSRYNPSVMSTDETKEAASKAWNFVRDAWNGDGSNKNNGIVGSLANYFSSMNLGGKAPGSENLENQARMHDVQAAQEDANAQQNQQIANRDYRGEAEKNAVANAATQNAQTVANLGNASAGAAALERTVGTADYDTHMNRQDTQREKAVEKQREAWGARQTAEEERQAAAAENNDKRNMDMYNSLAKYLSQGAGGNGTDTSTTSEQEGTNPAAVKDPNASKGDESTNPGATIPEGTNPEGNNPQGGNPSGTNMKGAGTDAVDSKDDEKQDSYDDKDNPWYHGYPKVDTTPRLNPPQGPNGYLPPNNPTIGNPLLPPGSGTPLQLPSTKGVWQLPDGSSAPLPPSSNTNIPIPPVPPLYPDDKKEQKQEQEQQEQKPQLEAPQEKSQEALPDATPETEPEGVAEDAQQSLPEPEPNPVPELNQVPTGESVKEPVGLNFSDGSWQQNMIDKKILDFGSVDELNNTDRMLTDEEKERVYEWLKNSDYDLIVNDATGNPVMGSAGQWLLKHGCDMDRLYGAVQDKEFTKQHENDFKKQLEQFHIAPKDTGVFLEHMGDFTQDEKLKDITSRLQSLSKEMQDFQNFEQTGKATTEVNDAIKQHGGKTSTKLFYETMFNRLKQDLVGAWKDSLGFNLGDYIDLNEGTWELTKMIAAGAGLGLEAAAGSMTGSDERMKNIIAGCFSRF